MIIDFMSDWPAYVFMAIFIFFVTYVIIKGNSGAPAVLKSVNIENKK
jgi:hypothetical protein